MELAPRLEEYLRRLDGASSVEVRENGHRVTTVEKLSWELRGAAAKPLLSIRSEQYNVTHSIVGIRADSDDRLALAVERFGNPRPGRLEFRRVDFVPPDRKLARQDFCPRLARILSERFPDESVENLKIGPDLEHSLSGNYARGVLRSGAASWALLAVPDGEAPATSENSLTVGLLWLARVRETSHKGFVTGLKLIVARGTSPILLHLAKALSSSIALEIYELDPRNELLVRIDRNALANQNTWLVPSRERQSLLDHAATAIEPIVAISPQAITLHPNTRAGEIVFRFRGLAFARWKDRVVFFGGGLRKKLTPSSQSEFRHLLHELELYRHPLATETRRPLYRAQPERWLEAIVRSDVTRVDASLDPRFVYTQLFASSATERGILDVLTVTTSGRLAIIELKASEHIHLPLQAAEYWLRIRHHLERDDFSRNGYFPQLQLQSAPPLVFLVSPALHFHSTTDLLLRHLSQSIEVVRIGIAETWRRGLRVVMRQ
jgi:hypothetical protein